MSIGISQNDWQTMQQKHYYGSTKVSQRRYVSNSTKVDNNANVQTSESGNTCTDGKDDGKIGLFSAIGHAVKGAVKGVVNGIKGCFTDKDGNFSIGKTLLTVAAGAACIAFPAVGLVACGVGAAVGTVNFAKGVYNAATAETDAQAKDAWEQVGDGAFTAVTSAVGIKSSLSAVKATSTSGIANADDAFKAVDKLDDVAKNNFLDKIDDISDLDNLSKADLSKIKNAAKEVGADTSKLGNLAEDASKLDKVKALASDMGSSTKNQAVVVRAKFGELKSNAKTTKDAKTYNKNSEQIEQLEAKKMETDLSTAEKNKLETLTKKNQELAQEYTDKGINIKEKASSLQDKKSVAQAAKDSFGKYTSQAKNKLTEQKTAFKDAISQNKGIKAKLAAIKEQAGSVKFNAIKSGLTEKGKAIYELLTDTNNGYAQAVKQYGYDNVLQVIETFAGYRVADEAV